MAKYMKLPIVIEAYQLSSQLPYPEWLREGIDKGIVDLLVEGHPPNGIMMINTLEGKHLANIDDFIIRGIMGELYPCKPDIFNLTYRIVIENEK